MRQQARFVVVGSVLLALAASAGGAVLHSNGSFVTNPTGGTGSIAGLPISNADPFTFPGNPTVFTTAGINAAANIGTAVADDFEVTGPGWNLDTVTLFAFQTSQTTATVNTIRINLWTETPFSAGSPGAPAVIPEPVLATSLSLPAGPGTFVAHRQSSTGTASVRPVFSYTVSLDGLPNGGELAPGRYWLEWSFIGVTSPSQNVFTPLISPRTSVSGHNARLLNSIDGSANGPRVWFEGREGFLAGQSEGRAVELPFVLGGSVIPAPGALWAGLALLAAGRRGRRS